MVGATAMTQLVDRQLLGRTVGRVSGAWAQSSLQNLTSGVRILDGALPSLAELCEERPRGVRPPKVSPEGFARNQAIKEGMLSPPHMGVSCYW